MKKPLSYIFLILTLTVFSGCSTERNTDTDKIDLVPSPYNDVMQNKNVFLSIKENKITVDTNEITLIFENKTATKYLYGDLTYLELEKDGIWYSFPSKDNIAWTMVAYQLSANSQKELIFPIHTYFDNIEKGTYRVVKKISISDDPQKVSFVIAEFTVE